MKFNKKTLYISCHVAKLKEKKEKRDTDENKGRKEEGKKERNVSGVIPT